MPISFDLAKDAPSDAELVVEGVDLGAVPDEPVLRAAGFEGKVGQTALDRKSVV